MDDDEHSMEWAVGTLAMNIIAEILISMSDTRADAMEGLDALYGDLKEGLDRYYDNLDETPHLSVN